MARAQKSAARTAADVPQNTFILDNGAYTIKAGFAPPTETPDDKILQACNIVPNCLVRSRERKVYVAAQSEEIIQWNEAVYRRPVENGQLVNWEAEKEIWDYSFFDGRTASAACFVSDPMDTTLVLAESPNTMPALQKNTDEIVMEEWGFGAYMRTVGPALNAYNDLHPLFEDLEAPNAASGLAKLPMECLLVIDSGYSYTTIVPCFQGHPIQRAVRRLDFGGKHITNLFKETISVRHFDLHQDTKIVNDIKEDVTFVSRDLKLDLEKTWKGNKRKSSISTSDSLEPPNRDILKQEDQPNEARIDYVLPDGVTLLRGYARKHDPSKAAEKLRKQALSHSDANEIVMTLGNERFTVPEMIFSPSDIGSKQPGIAECVIQSLTKLPPLIQATMLANAVVVGGNSKIPGFVERLQAELRMKARVEWPVRVRRMEDPVTSTWLGGVRMSMNHRDTIRNIVVSRDQYNEYGSVWMGRHFATVK